MRTATEHDWIDATSGNAAPDREEFERWALSIRGAPRRSDPRVWTYLLMMLDEMDAVERGAYGEMYDELADSVAYGVVRHFQQLPSPLASTVRAQTRQTENARRTRAARLPAFRSFLKNRSERVPPPPPPPASVQALRRSRLRDEDDDSRPFDPEERVPFGTRPHHFSYPNPGGSAAFQASVRRSLEADRLHLVSLDLGEQRGRAVWTAVVGVWDGPNVRLAIPVTGDPHADPAGLAHRITASVLDAGYSRNPSLPSHRSPALAQLPPRRR